MSPPPIRVRFRFRFRVRRSEMNESASSSPPFQESYSSLRNSWKALEMFSVAMQVAGLAL